MALFPPNSRPFGLEIGTTHLRTLAVEQRWQGTKIISVNEQRLHFNPWLKNGLRNKHDLSRHILQLLEKARPQPITAQAVSLSLPDGAIFSQVLSLPRLSEAELRQTIPYEIAESLPLPLEETYLDWQVIGQTQAQTKKAMRCLVIAAPKQLVDDLVDVMEKSNLKPIGLENESFAFVRSINTSLGSGPSLIISVKSRYTSLTIATRQAIHAIKVIAVGHEQLKESNSAKEDWLETIHQVVKDHDKDRGASHRLKAIILTGEVSRSKELAQFCQESTGLDCQIGHPAIQLPNRQPIHPRFSIVLGLALRP